MDDGALRRVLDASSSWRGQGGRWRPVDPAAPPRVQLQQLEERRKRENAPIKPTRRVRALVDLVLDPAYALVKQHGKLLQLQHICAAQMQRLEAELRSGRAATVPLPVPYLSADSAQQVGVE